MGKKLGYIVILIASLSVAGDIKFPTGMKASFFQKVTNQHKKVLKYSGSLVIWKNRIKWLYTKPSKKEVCSDGIKLVVVDHELEQVGFYKMNKSLNLQKVINSARHHKNNIYVARYQKKNYTIAIDKNGYISQIAYKDDMDNIVNLHFSRIKILKRAPSSRALACPYPRSYDLLGGNF
jgi:outer membrane lipoprotein carrier protein